MENNTALQVFNFGGQEVRTVTINGKIYFVVADACKVLEITNVSQVTDRLDQDGVCLTEVIDRLGRKQKAAAANEPNLYRLIFRSDKPQAKAFQDWVYNEVLPSIRKTGSYSVSDLQQQITHLAQRLDQLERITTPALSTSAEDLEWGAFFASWYQIYGSAWKYAREIAHDLALPRSLRGRLTQETFTLLLGKALSKHIHATRSIYRLEADQDTHTKCRLWRVTTSWQLM